MKEAAQCLDAHARGEVKKITAPTVFEQLQESSMPASEKTLKRMAHEALTVVTAGSETTATSLTYAIYFILSDESVLNRLREEVSTTYSNYQNKPPLSALQELPFLVSSGSPCNISRNFFPDLNIIQN
jgi:cytochrome P450